MIGSLNDVIEVQLITPHRRVGHQRARRAECAVSRRSWIQGRLSAQEASQGPTLTRHAPPSLFPPSAETRQEDRYRCLDASHPARPIQTARAPEPGIADRGPPIGSRQPLYRRDGAAESLLFPLIMPRVARLMVVASSRGPQRRAPNYG